MASVQKTSSLKQGLRSSFSSGGFSLGGARLTKTKTDDTNQDQSQISVEQKPDPALPASSQVSQAEKLDTLDEIISEIEESKKSETQKSTKPAQESAPIQSPFPAQEPLGNVAQVLPQTLNQVVSPPTSQSSKKETLVSAYASQESTPDSGASVQEIEKEKNPEIPSEVESFLKHAEDHANKLPEEIVIADNQEISKVTHHSKAPVLVLPITSEEEKQGRKKSSKFSIRWLVEWSYKMMKKFSGKVIYRMDE